MLCQCLKKPNGTRYITVERFRLKETSTLEEIAQQLLSKYLVKTLKDRNTILNVIRPSCVKRAFVK